MNLGACISIILLGAGLCRFALPIIFRILWKAQWDATHFDHHVFCREDGSEWEGASPSHYSYMPKRK